MPNSRPSVGRTPQPNHGLWVNQSLSGIERVHSTANHCENCPWMAFLEVRRAVTCAVESDVRKGRMCLTFMKA